MEQPDDVVDLTESSPLEPPARRAPQAGQKRRRSPEPIDLEGGPAAGATASTAAAGAAAGDEEVEIEDDQGEAAAARARIMQFARRVNQQRGIAGSGAPLASTQLQEQQQEQQQPGADAGSSRQQLQGLGSGAAGGGGSAAAAGSGAAGDMQAAPPAASAGPNSLLAQLAAERMVRQAQRQPPSTQQQQQQAQQAPTVAAAANGGSQLAAQGPHRQQRQQAGQQQVGRQQAGQQQQHQQQGAEQVSLLTYNVWFREDIHVQQRMAAIGAIIAARQPDFVCLQEVTPLIYRLFAAMAWWAGYHASPCPPGAPYFTVLLWSRSSVRSAGGCHTIPFENSIMGRDLTTVGGTVGGWPIRVATTHLESPTGWNQLYGRQRVAQCKQAAALLDQAREEDVLWAGDMNWGPDDGSPPLPGGWSDAWVHLHGGGDPGLTYDPRTNPMLKPSNRIRRRLDRVFVRLSRWRLHAMELVGREALPGLAFEGRPVLPSDHFGVYLVLRPAAPPS